MQASFQPYDLLPSSGEAAIKIVNDARKTAQRTAKANSKAVTVDSIVIRNKGVIALIDVKQRHIQHSMQAKPLKVPMKTWLPVIVYCLGEFTGAVGLPFVVGAVLLEAESKQALKAVRWLVKHQLLNLVVMDKKEEKKEEKEREL